MPRKWSGVTKDGIPIHYWYGEDGREEEGPFLCPACEKPFPKWNGLVRHVRRKHRGSLIVKKTRPPHIQKERHAETKREWFKKKEAASARDRQKKKALAKIRDQLARDEEITDVEELKKKRSYTKSDNVELIYKQSTITGAGHGLFANRNFVKNDLITIYEGEIVEAETIETWSKKEREFCMDLPDGKILVGLSTPVLNKGLGSFINRINNPRQHNCRFVIESDRKTVVVYATKSIVKGQELLTCYKKGCELPP